MAGFLRGKQAGIQGDLSAGILQGLFAPDDLERYGINSQVGTLAYDPVQSLLAIGTNETLFGSGQIYVFGQKRVQCKLTLPRRASVKILQFCADRLVSIDSKNELIVWDLRTQKKICSHSTPGLVTALVTDPMLDWAFLGLQNGEIIAYDLDREKLAPLRLPNYWREKSPKSRFLSIVSLQLHPRDIGQLLIGYSEGAVIYSFKQNLPIKYFQYEIPPGAPGGNADPVKMGQARRPHILEATWHPTGTFVAVTYDDSSLVFFDPKDGRVVMARNLTDIHVDRPATAAKNPNAFNVRDPYMRMAWCCKENPDDTGLLIAGGIATNASEKGLTFLELGQTPVYATASWSVLANHLEGKRNLTLPLPPGAEVVNFCLIPRTSPHYAGAQDPIAILVLLASGELITLSFPTGHPISPTNQLHPSVALVHPFVTKMFISAVERGRWLGMVENRQQGPLLVKGGAEGVKPMRRYEARNIVQVAHGDGTVRIWDAGHGDEIENGSTLQVDIARALDRYTDIEVSRISMACVTGELAVGTVTGEVVVYRWGGNPTYGREGQSVQSRRGGVTDISPRTEPTLKEGLQPFALYDKGHGPISALKMSDVGFVGVGTENGIFSIMDLRGPSVIICAPLSDFVKSSKTGSIMKRSSSQPTVKQDWPVQIEFGVMTLEGDNYSSIACFVGTNLGKVITFKILPQANGAYVAAFAGLMDLGDRVISINAINADTGKPASATGPAVAALRTGKQVNGTLVVVTQTGVRIFKPASSKGAHKQWDNVFCDAASVSEMDSHGFALVGVFGDGTTRAYSLPGLKEIGGARIEQLDKTRISNSIVTVQGDIFVWTGPSEIALLNVWGTGQPLPRSQDKLYNPDALIPPRPTISNLQWISGTQYVSPTDLDLLIGGPDRPPSKRMMAAAAAEDRAARLGGRTAGVIGKPGEPEGWGDYLTRQLNERTEKMNIMGDSVDRLQENSAGWADDVSKFVGRQKRNFMMGAVKNSLGF